MFAALLLMLAPAEAAEVTYIPPFLRGDIDLSYQLGLSRGSLVEDGGSAGLTGTEEHRLHYGAVLGVAPGAAAFIEIPNYLKSSITFQDPQEMIFDPTLQQGSLAAGDLLEDAPTVTGSGQGGIWMGLRGTPFSPDVFPGVGQRATFLLEIAYRTPDETNLWTSDGETRGAGPGASALRLRGAFSREFDASEPYLRVTWLRQNTIEADLLSSDGSAGASGAVIQPPDSVDVDFGIEAIAARNPVSGASFAFDFRFGYAYYTDSVLPSGLYLPSVLATTDGQVITQSEYSVATAGLGLCYQVFQYLRLNIAVDGDYYTPRQVEHPYPVYTDMDTFGIRGIAGMQIMIRTQDD